jgi:hypothetical protein
MLALKMEDSKNGILHVEDFISSFDIEEIRVGNLISENSEKLVLTEFIKDNPTKFYSGVKIRTTEDVMWVLEDSGNSRKISEIWVNIFTNFLAGARMQRNKLIA